MLAIKIYFSIDGRKVDFRFLFVIFGGKINVYFFCSLSVIKKLITFPGLFINYLKIVKRPVKPFTRYSDSGHFYIAL